MLIQHGEERGWAELDRWPALLAACDRRWELKVEVRFPNQSPVACRCFSAVRETRSNRRNRGGTLKERQHLLWVKRSIPCTMKKVSDDVEHGQVFVRNFEPSGRPMGIFDGRGFPIYDQASFR
jgi:hypothetical protein